MADNTTTLERSIAPRVNTVRTTSISGPYPGAENDPLAAALLGTAMTRGATPSARVGQAFDTMQPDLGMYDYGAVNYGPLSHGYGFTNNFDSQALSGNYRQAEGFMPYGDLYDERTYATSSIFDRPSQAPTMVAQGAFPTDRAVSPADPASRVNRTDAQNRLASALARRAVDEMANRPAEPRTSPTMYPPVSAFAPTMSVPGRQRPQPPAQPQIAMTGVTPPPPVSRPSYSPSARPQRTQPAMAYAPAPAARPPMPQLPGARPVGTIPTATAPNDMASTSDNSLARAMVARPNVPNWTWGLERGGNTAGTRESGFGGLGALL